MNVLISGGAGYIGTELVYTLGEIDEVENVIVYDNLSRGNYNLFIGHKLAPRKVKVRAFSLLCPETWEIVSPFTPMRLKAFFTSSSLWG